VLAGIAKGASNPDLQMKAINYLGVHGSQENRALLGEIYAASSDVAVKKAILRSFMVAGDRERVLTAARSEQTPELRAEAVRQLGVMGGHAELWDLYQKEASLDVKKQILQARFVGGDATRLVELAKTEKDPELRRRAVRNLGLIGADKTGAALVALYQSDKDPAIRKEVINGLFIQGNDTALIDLARKETDPVMKKDIVNRLSHMNSKAALAYMLEILNK
jgi:HEAT repeat protein